MRSTRQLHDEDLEWFFSWSAADMGASSSWGPMVAAASGGFGGRRDPDARMNDRRLDATTRHRRIRARLERLPAEQVVVLHAVFGPDKAPREVALRLGQLGVLGCRTRAAEAGYQRAVRASEKHAPRTVAHWLAQACVAGGGDVEAVAIEAAKMLAEAFEAWRATAADSRRPCR